MNSGKHFFLVENKCKHECGEYLKQEVGKQKKHSARVLDMVLG